MKCKFTITTILILIALEIFGQDVQKKNIEFGLNYSPTITFNQKYKRPPAFNTSNGIFMKHTIYRRLKMGIGLEYQRLKLNTVTFYNCDPTGNHFICESPSQNVFNVIRAPIWISLNMNNKPHSKIKTDLISGYAFGKLLDSIEKEVEYQLSGLNDLVHFGFIGIEFTKELSKQHKLTIGTHLEWTNIYNMRYGEIRNLKLVLRITR